MTIKDELEKDIKTAMLAGDKTLVTTLRGVKSAILYAEVATNARDTGLPEDQVLSILAKEAKKRQESADMYITGGSADRAQAELAEKAVIEKYLPQQLSDEDLKILVLDAIKEVGVTGPAAMGQVIGKVKQKAGSQADGGRIAALVKENLS